MSTTPHRASSTRRNSRPTTPLRASSRSSFTGVPRSTEGTFPLDALSDQFSELSNSLLYLQDNMQELQVMHESLNRFSESFASFLYGLSVNAYCCEFPEAPAKESWQREESGALGRDNEETPGGLLGMRSTGAFDERPNPARHFDETYVTNDTSFVAEPPRSIMKEPQTPAPSKAHPTKTPAKRPPPAGRGIPTRGGRGTRGTGIPRGGGGSGIPRPGASRGGLYR